MKTLEEAAKMLIVAWVKDWSMRTLFDVLTDQRGDISDEKIAKMAQHFPFMPTHIHWYISNRGCGVNTQQFVAQAYPKLSEKLYSLDRNEDRLKCAPYIMKQKAKDVRAKSKFSSKDMTEHRKDVKQYRQALVSYNESRATFKKFHKGAWNVVK
jgi:hypothetical protein